MDYRKLDELNKLRLSGALTDEEFEREKRKLFEEETTASATSTPAIPLGLQEDVYLGLMNFLILVPYIGWIVPIVMWIIGKKSSEKIKMQGTYIINWLITWFVIGMIIASIWISFILIFNLSGHIFRASSIIGNMLVGLSLLTGIGAIFIAFPIIGGVKGLKGQTWKYPLSIPFVK